MKRLLVCVLLVGVVGCGEKDSSRPASGSSALDETQQESNVPTEREKEDAVAVRQIILAMNTARRLQIENAIARSPRKTDDWSMGRALYFEWTHHLYVLDVDLIHAPADYRALHERLAATLKLALNDNYKRVRQDDIRWDVSFIPASTTIAQVTIAKQEYEQLVDKYRLIAGEKPEEVPQPNSGIDRGYEGQIDPGMMLPVNERSEGIGEDPGEPEED